MKELIQKRLEKLQAEREKLVTQIVDFYARTDFLAAEGDRAALENRHGIPQARRKIWELKVRTGVLAGCLDLEDDDAILDYLELVDGAAMQALEKGLPETATRSDFLEFLGHGFECDECRSTLTALKVVRDLREKNQTRKNARKGG